MRLKKLGAALVVIAALGAVLASSAFAAAFTEDVKWYTGSGSGTELSGTETMSSEAVEPGTFTTTVAGTVYELEATGVNCVECKITNTGGSAGGSGTLEFTGVKVLKPSGCSVATTITTKALTVSADWMSGATNYVKFTPTKGEETAFATVAITGCALETSIVPKGSVFVESANATGVLAAEQQVTSSGAINTAAGGNLHVGTEAATLNAKAKFKMTGAHKTEGFGTH